MFLTEFQTLVKEHFDLSDSYTRQYIVGLDEAVNDQLLAALSTRLYDNIVAKVDDIDFGTIPRSRGDITKIEKFEMTTESLDIIRKLVIEYKENPAQVDTILSAIENIKDNKSLFIKAYSLNVELPMLIYNLMSLSVIRSTSLIIATCINYIADPSTKSMKMAFDKVAYQNTESDVLYQQLVTYNDMCKDGSLVKLLNAVIKNNGKFREDVNYSDLNSTGEPDAVAQPMDVNNTLDNGHDIDAPAAMDAPELFPGAARSTDECDGPDCPNIPDVPNVEKVPGSEMPETPVDNDDDVIAGEEPTANIPVTTVPATQAPPTVPAPGEQKVEPAVTPVVPDNNPEVQPVIPEKSLVEKLLDRLRGKEVNEADDFIKDMVDAADKSSEDAKIDKDIEKDAQKNEKEMEKASQDAAKNAEKNAANTSAEESVTSPEPPELEDSMVQNEANVDKALDKIRPIISSVPGKAAIGAGVIIAALYGTKMAYTAFVKVIIPWLRATIYTFNYTKMKISEYFEIQAELIEANATELENTAADDDNKKKKIIAKQRKWADRFHKWSNIFNIDRKSAEKKASDDIKRDEKEKHKIDKNDEGDDVLF